MKVKEAIELINNSEELYSLNDAENIIDYEKQLASDIDISRHRWYETSTSYFQLENGILGINGVSNIYSEHMMAPDFNVQPQAFEGEEFTTISYRSKRNN